MKWRTRDLHTYVHIHILIRMWPELVY